MEIIEVIPRGYCKGVVRAIELAKETARQYPGQKITMLGSIVHNQYVVDALSQYGIQAVENKKKTRLELLDEINSGVVIFTAHGVSEAVKKKALEKNLIIADASCSDVEQTKSIVNEHLALGYTVFYIGIQGHPEAEAVLSISNAVIPIYGKETLPHIQINPEKLLLINQTTMNMIEIGMLIEAIKKQWPQVKVQEEICNATRIRQQAVRNLTDIDLLIVVGDPHSNNTNQLKQIGLESGIAEVMLIETVNDIEPEKLITKDRIAVTSGASTPTYLTQQVIFFLKELALGKTPSKPIIDVKAII